MVDYGMEIRTARFVVSNVDVNLCPQGDRPEYAFIGRSNVGKSSLINMLVNCKGLAKTSSTPGKTLLINHFLINDSWFLVDLPGYGYARRGREQRNALRRIISAYVLRRVQLTCLFLLVDARLLPQRIDLDFVEWLGVNGVPFSVVFTKADKPSSVELRRNVEAFQNALMEQWEELPPFFVTSAVKKSGRAELLDYIEGVNRSLGVK